MKAGSKVIIRYRLAKRLNKIRQFLKDCNNKEEVQKKIQEDYAKSKDLAKQGKTKVNLLLLRLTKNFHFHWTKLQQAASSFNLKMSLKQLINRLKLREVPNLMMIKYYKKLDLIKLKFWDMEI